MDYIKENIKEYLPDAFVDASVVIEETLRNNDRICQGLMICRKGETITFRAVRDGQSTQWAIRETIAFTENTQGSLEQPFALNLTNQVVTGILEINRQTGIYPNPVSHYLYIKGDVFDIRQVRVVNTNGAVLFSRELDENQGLDVSTLVPGMYILIIDRGDVIESHKFIKK